MSTHLSSHFQTSSFKFTNFFQYPTGKKERARKAALQESERQLNESGIGTGENTQRENDGEEMTGSGPQTLRIDQEEEKTPDPDVSSAEKADEPASS